MLLQVQNAWFKCMFAGWWNGSCKYDLPNQFMSISLWSSIWNFGVVKLIVYLCYRFHYHQHLQNADVIQIILTSSSSQAIERICNVLTCFNILCFCLCISTVYTYKITPTFTNIYNKDTFAKRHIAYNFIHFKELY